MMKKDITKYSLIFLGISFLIALIYQTVNVKELKEYQKTLLSESFSGILKQKEDLKRGEFRLRILINNKTEKEVILGNSLEYFSKYTIGDSIVKLPNSFLFKVYRDTTGTGIAEYMYTVGYTP